MIVIQGDPVFDFPDTETVDERTTVVSTLPPHDGYDAFLAALIAETKAFTGQVVLVHGDSHYFRVDKPLMQQTMKKADMVKNLTRVENFGSGSVHWIKVTVTPTNSNVFNFEPMIVKGN
jgi:pheromone shutdown protein TraB